MKSLNLSLVMFAALCLPIPAFARDHASEYQVGTFLGTARADDGSYSMAQCSGGGCSATGYRASHNQHQIETTDGVYTLDAPVSIAGTILVGMLTPGGVSPTLHKGWFMDDLREGQPVLFYPDCNKHHRCKFWLPNPDKVGKEIFTTGWVEPSVATTNTATLCDTGKLSATVAAQVCGRGVPDVTSAPPAAPTYLPISAPSERRAPKALSKSPRAPINPLPEQHQRSTPVVDADGPAQTSGPMFLNTDSPEVEPLIKAGQASRGAVLTIPPAADVYIDGKKIGTSPLAVVLVKNGDEPRLIRIVKDGFEPIDKKVVPDGTTIRIEVYLQRKSSE